MFFFSLLYKQDIQRKEWLSQKLNDKLNTFEDGLNLIFYFGNSEAKIKNNTLRN